MSQPRIISRRSASPRPTKTLGLVRTKGENNQQEDSWSVRAARATVAKHVIHHVHHIPRAWQKWGAWTRERRCQACSQRNAWLWEGRNAQDVCLWLMNSQKLGLFGCFICPSQQCTYMYTHTHTPNHYHQHLTLLCFQAGEMSYRQEGKPCQPAAASTHRPQSPGSGPYLLVSKRGK